MFKIVTICKKNMRNVIRVIFIISCFKSVFIYVKSVLMIEMIDIDSK